MFTPDHLSFSGTLLRNDGRVLLTRRASARTTVCTWEYPVSGSPRPAESLLAAVGRCAERDLGIIVSADVVSPVMPTLGNRADANTAPIQLHPFYVISSEDAPRISPELETRWIQPRELGHAARSKPQSFDPLVRLHAQLLPFLGGRAGAPPEDISLLERATG